MNLGFVGLGNIGAPCAGHFIEAAHWLTVEIDKSRSAHGRAH